MPPEDNFLRAQRLAEKLGVNVDVNDSVPAVLVTLMEALLLRVEASDRTILHHMAQHQEVEQELSKHPPAMNYSHAIQCHAIQCHCGMFVNYSENVEVIVCSNCGKRYQVLIYDV